MGKGPYSPAGHPQGAPPTVGHGACASSSGVPLAVLALGAGLIPREGAVEVGEDGGQPTLTAFDHDGDGGALAELPVTSLDPHGPHLGVTGKVGVQRLLDTHQVRHASIDLRLVREGCVLPEAGHRAHLDRLRQAQDFDDVSRAETPALEQIHGPTRQRQTFFSGHLIHWWYPLPVGPLGAHRRVGKAPLEPCKVAMPRQDCNPGEPIRLASSRPDRPLTRHAKDPHNQRNRP